MKCLNLNLIHNLEQEKLEFIVEDTLGILTWQW